MNISKTNILLGVALVAFIASSVSALNSLNLNPLQSEAARYDGSVVNPRFTPGKPKTITPDNNPYIPKPIPNSTQPNPKPIGNSPVLYPNNQNPKPTTTKPKTPVFNGGGGSFFCKFFGLGCDTDYQLPEPKAKNN